MCECEHLHILTFWESQVGLTDINLIEFRLCGGFLRVSVNAVNSDNIKGKLQHILRVATGFKTETENQVFGLILVETETKN